MLSHFSSRSLTNRRCVSLNDVYYVTVAYHFYIVSQIALFQPEHVPVVQVMDDVSKFEENEVYLVKCAVQFFYRHIRFDDSTVVRMGKNPVFTLFDERRYHYKLGGSCVLVDSLYETTEIHVAAFILSILHQGMFSTSSIVCSLVLLSRFKEVSRVSLHTYTWRLLFLTSLLIVDKCTEEKPIRNASLSRIFPVVNSAELAVLEATFLTEIKFNTFIKCELFNSLVEKLLMETIPVQIDQMVQNSDFVAQMVLPNMKTLPHTPELYAPVTAVKTSAAKNLSRVLSSSSFIDKSNDTLNRSRILPSPTSRRRMSVGGPHEQIKFTYPISSITRKNQWNSTF